MRVSHAKHLVLEKSLIGTLRDIFLVRSSQISVFVFLLMLVVGKLMGLLVGGALCFSGGRR